jgi:putative MATE family efflux protein
MAEASDLTQGPLPGHFRRIAVPAALGMLFSTLYNVVDVWYAGKLSTDEQAGLAISATILMLFNAFGIGLGSGLSALVGNAIGAKDQTLARRTTLQGISYGAIGSIVLTLVGVVLTPTLVGALSEPGAYRDAGIDYMMLLMLAVPGFIMAFAGNGILQAQGDAVSMQRAMVVAFFANVGLNPLMIWGLPGLWDGIGFDGIAASTVISQSGVALFILYRAFGTNLAAAPRKSELTPDLPMWRDIIAQQVPMAMTFVVMILSAFIVQYHLKGFGGASVAAYGIALRIEQLLLLPTIGLSTALLPIAAQNYGAQALPRVQEAFRTSLRYGWSFMAITCPVLFLAAPWAMRAFTSDPEVIAIGVDYLHIEAVILPIYASLFAVNSLLQALKRPKWTFWIGVYRQLLAVPFFVWLLSGPLGFGVYGVWVGIAISVVSGFVLAAVLVERVARPRIGSLMTGRCPEPA